MGWQDVQGDEYGEVQAQVLSYRRLASRPVRTRRLPQEVFTAETLRYMRSQAAGTGEWVVELLGPLMLVYCAGDGSLSEDQILAMNEFAEELCRRILRASTPASPRGMEHQQ